MDVMSKQDTTDKEMAHGFEMAKILDKLAKRTAKQSTLDQFFKKM